MRVHACQERYTFSREVRSQERYKFSNEVRIETFM